MAYVFPTFTTTTSTTTVPGPAFLLVSSVTTGSIYSANDWTWQKNMLAQDIGAPVGIGLGQNLGHLYYTDPGKQLIARYELAIRNGRVELYDDEPVFIAFGVNAEWIDVDYNNNVFYTDPVAHSINKIYSSTLDLIAQGAIQPADLKVVSYMDIYKRIGRPADCIHAHFNGTKWPEVCDADCALCLDLWQQPYIYQVYTDQGHPAGLQILTPPYPGQGGAPSWADEGGTLLWGNEVDGLQRGSVVRAMLEPELFGSETSFAITPLTKLWNSVIQFLQLPNNANGEDLLYITANGTVGEPPIPGDVHGAVIVVEPTTPSGPSQFVTMDWNLVKPRSMAYDGMDTLYVADDSGVIAINSQMTYQGALEQRIMTVPGSSGMVYINHGMPCYEKMLQRGSSQTSAALG